jgi:hypothetical protein
MCKPDDHRHPLCGGLPSVRHHDPVGHRATRHEDAGATAADGDPLAETALTE